MTSESQIPGAIAGRRTTRVMLLREYERWRSEASRWQAVGQVALRWQGGYNPDNILNEAIRDCAQAWEATACAVLVLDAAHNQLMLRASLGLDLASVHPIPVKAESRNRLERLAEEQVKRWLGEKTSAFGRPALYAYPLVFHQLPVGVLCISREAGRPDNGESESAAWRALIAQIACAIFWEETARHLLTQERVEKDLHFAHMLKSRLLALEPPTLPGYRLAVRCLRCMEVSGDFWDFVPQADGRLVFLLGESSGRGIKAALNIALIVQEIRRLLAEGNSLSEAVVALNRMVIKEGGRSHMVNLCLGEIDAGRKRINLVRAGTMRAVLCKDGVPRALTAAGTPLGVLSDYAATPQALSLAPGSALVLATDGFGQCENSEGHRYSTEQMLRFLAERCAACTMGDKPLAVELAAHIERHAGDQILKDDVALLSIECLR
ncbi:MAG: SpoIIE family protein phosphatase [Planctomycetota bacterium]|nr:SpoIIE family protein phosphatase [Planctomycetota bacterium]